MFEAIKLKCLRHSESKVMVPSVISGELQEQEFHEWSFQHPQPPAPPPGAGPKELALYMAQQPPVTADVLVRSLNPSLKFEVGKVYLVSIHAPEEL